MRGYYQKRYYLRLGYYRVGMPKKVVSLKLEPELLALVDADTDNRNAWITEAVLAKLGLAGSESKKAAPPGSPDPQHSSESSLATRPKPEPTTPPRQPPSSKHREFESLRSIYQIQGKDPKTARNMAHKKIYG